jgi:very-short-patch-repair endonuclease
MPRERPSHKKREVLRANARDLRSHSTPAEVLLWTRLRADQLGCRFRRQYRIESYIVDFVCPGRKLVVELDGASHDDKTEADARRDARLGELGFIVLRFSNQDVFRFTDAVIGEIERVLAERGGPSPRPSP